MKFIPHEYQQRAIDRVVSDEHVGLFLDMGLGKTVITLTAIEQLIYDTFEVSKVLVIAPKRVAEDTWSREHEKWDHLKHLRLSKVLGNPDQRLKAVDAEADIYVIGRDNTQWLVDHWLRERRWPYDMIVIDELSGFKSPDAKRWKALKKTLKVTKRVVGLTGTPSPNGLIDLWAQLYLLDQGERLGRTLGEYRATYFTPGPHQGYVVYKWNIRPGAQKVIEHKISDICMSMSAKDYLTLPKRIDNLITLKLTDKQFETYRKMEAEQLLKIDDDTEVVALNAAAVMTKLLQIASGQVYDESGKAVLIHDAKLKALEEIVEDSTSPVLVFYSFRSDASRIQESIKGVRELKSAEDIADWNEGKIKVLIAHPASVGYGLNLQDGGHTIVWYGLTWSLELYQQANARLHRQGQQKPVIVHHLIAEGTVDEQVMRALQAKDTSQAALLAALKERR